MELAQETNDNLDVEQAIRQHRGIIYHCITKVLRSFPQFNNSDVADDIFQEVCILLMEKLRKHDPARGAKLSTFIGMIATHATYDFLTKERRKSRHGPQVDIDHLVEMADPDASPEETVIGKDLERNILAARKQLPPSLRRAFDLEMTVSITDPRELADAMGINRKTVYTRRAKLRERLASALPEDWQESLAKKAA